MRSATQMTPHEELKPRNNSLAKLATQTPSKEPKLKKNSPDKLATQLRWCMLLALALPPDSGQSSSPISLSPDGGGQEAYITLATFRRWKTAKLAASKRWRSVATPRHWGGMGGERERDRQTVRKVDYYKTRSGSGQVRYLLIAEASVLASRQQVDHQFDSSVITKTLNHRQDERNSISLYCPPQNRYHHRKG